jgi:hypothetical protein
MCLQGNCNILTNYLALLVAHHKCTPKAKINISRTGMSRQLSSKVRHSAALRQVNPINIFTASFPKYHFNITLFSTRPIPYCCHFRMCHAPHSVISCFRMCHAPHSVISCFRMCHAPHSFQLPSLSLHRAFCSLFQYRTNKCTCIVFNRLKFTLKYLERTYMFR